MDTFQIVEIVSRTEKKHLMLDRGLKCRRELDKFPTRNFKAGTIVTLVGENQLERRPQATKKDLFTYRAELLRVVDGDTILANLDIGFGDWQEERLRLRGIDAPELKFPDGVRAKQFLEKQFEGVDAFVVTTSKSPEKWGRYVSDVFIGDVFVNQVLVDSGHARIVN